MRYLLESVTSVTCSGDGINTGNPDANFDTVILEGYGRINGVSGYYMEVTLTDNGEPLRKSALGVDTVQLAMMMDPDATDFLYATGGDPGKPEKLRGGNHQAHGGDRG